MPNKTNIEWTDYTSNPIAPVGGGWGCSKVSPGCDHCYAERLNKWRGNKRDFQGRWKFYLKGKELEDLRRLNDRVANLGTPTYVFLGDMTDIFHPDVPFDMLVDLFFVLDGCSALTFQVLTKRPGEMAHFANWVLPEAYDTNCPVWPANVWAGTSVEQEWDGRRHLTKRLDLLAQLPAKVRFVSYEPALGPVDLRPWLASQYCANCGDGSAFGRCCGEPLRINEPVLSWVIAGGESGRWARPIHHQWARDVRDQCQEAGVPYFFKQWGEYAPFEAIGAASWSKVVRRSSDRTRRVGVVKNEKGDEMFEGRPIQIDGRIGASLLRVGTKASGAMLDGREWREFPNV